MGIEIELDGVDRGFSEAAGRYEDWAHPQRYVAEQLMLSLSMRGNAPENILDIGCGTGLLTAMLAEQYPEATIHGVDLAAGMVAHCRQQWLDQSRMKFTQADAETFDCEERFDLITSSCSFQWFPRPQAVCKNLCRLLRPGGAFMMAVFLEGSLSELDESYRAVCDRPLQGLAMRTREVYRQAVEQSGFTVIDATLQTQQCYYRDGLEVMRSLKEIGATFSHQPGYRPLTVSQMRQLSAYYAKHFSDTQGRVSVTYPVLYLLVETS